MKNLFARFLKDTRGVVMMEYIVLGLFAVSITVASVLALGTVYCEGLSVMGLATVGDTQAAANQLADAKANCRTAFGEGVTYAKEFAKQEGTIIDSYAEIVIFDGSRNTP